MLYTTVNIINCDKMTEIKTEQIIEEASAHKTTNSNTNASNVFVIWASMLIIGRMLHRHSVSVRVSRMGRVNMVRITVSVTTV